MKVLYFDLIGGASGDMILGALIDAGLSADKLRVRLDALRLDDFQLQVRPVTKSGFSATKVDVLVADDVPERHLAEIERIVTRSDLAPEIKAQAMAIFQRLGQVEAGIHGASLEKVHLHELGGVDTIVDVVGALVGLDALGVERVYASEVPLGRGFIQGAHGQIPLPAPATVALLKGAPVRGREIDAELVTPTGAVLLSHLVARFGPIPPMALQSIGYGAGGRDLPFPNLARVLIGEQSDHSFATVETLVMLESNIDDLNPEFYDHVIELLFDAGALDVTLIPAQMKKNRPATQIQVLSKPSDVATLERILFRETSTLGVRHRVIERHALQRSIIEVETRYGAVRVKQARLEDGESKFAPEYEDCRNLARQHDIPLREIYQLAFDAATEDG
jgi:hypothetical protein